MQTKTRKTLAGRDNPAGDPRTAPTVGKKNTKPPTMGEAVRDTAADAAGWFRAKPHERYPLLAMTGVYGTGTALNAIHAHPNGIGAAALVAVCGIVAASRKIKDGARAFKTCVLAAGTGIWVTVAGFTGTIGTDAPHIAMNIGYAALAGTAYVMYRRDDVTRGRIEARKRRESWPEFAAAVGLSGAVVEKREDTRLGERLIVNVKGTGKRASAIAHGDVAVRIAEHYRMPKSRVRVTEVTRDATLVSISIRRVDPWKHAIPHPVLAKNPEITLPVPNDITAGPLIIGQDPETGDPLELPVWDEDGARRTMVVAALGGGKSVLANNVIERVTACDNAIVWGIDLTKAKDLREWRKGGAVPIAACGPDERTKAALMLEAGKKIIEYRSKTNRQAVFQPGENRPMILFVLDEIDGLVAGNSAMAQAAKENLKFIGSKGRSESVGVMILGQRGTAAWLGGADIRVMLEQLVLLRVNRIGEVRNAVGDAALDLPDMTKYGEGKAGVAVVHHLDGGGTDAGRTFKFNDLDDILAISRSRTPTSLEPGLIEHLGDIWTKLTGGDPSTSPEEAETIRKLDAEVEACMPEDLREQWRARQEKLDKVRKYAEQMPTVEHDPRTEDIVAERRRQFAEQAKAAGVPADARQVILRLAAEPNGVTNRAVVDALKIDRVKAFRYLTALKEESVIEQRGRGRSVTYVLASDAEPDDAHSDENDDAE